MSSGKRPGGDLLDQATRQAPGQVDLTNLMRLDTDEASDTTMNTAISPDAFGAYRLMQRFFVRMSLAVTVAIDYRGYLKHLSLDIGEDQPTWTKRVDTLRQADPDSAARLDIALSASAGLCSFHLLPLLPLALLDEQDVPLQPLSPALLHLSWEALADVDPYHSLGDDARALRDLTRLHAPLGNHERQRLEQLNTEERHSELSLLSEAAQPQIDELIRIFCHLPALREESNPPDTLADLAATDLRALMKVVEDGREAPGATPAASAAMRRLLIPAAERALARQMRAQGGEAPKEPQRALADLSIIQCIWARFMPLFLPGHVPGQIQMRVAADSWLSAKLSWTGDSEWRDDLRTLNTDLKALARQNQLKQPARALSPGQVMSAAQCQETIDHGWKAMPIIYQTAQEQFKDLHPRVLDLDPRWPAQRLAMDTALLIIHTDARVHFYPPESLGPVARALSHALQGLPDPTGVPELPDVILGFKPSDDTFACCMVTTMLFARYEQYRQAQMAALSSEPPTQPRAEHSLFLNPDDLLDVVSAGLPQMKALTAELPAFRSITYRFEKQLLDLWNSLGRPSTPDLFGAPPLTRAALTHLYITAEVMLTEEERLTSEAAQISQAGYPVGQHQGAQGETTGAAGQDITWPEGRLHPSNPDEQRVMEALEGRVMVLLGGEARPHARQALITALGLKDVDWIASDEYDHGRAAEARLRAPGVAVVVFALRWAAHAHGSIRDLARELGLPAISLPGGYNPRMVLHQLSQQVSATLEVS